MELKKIDDAFFVAPQISADDILDIKQQGIKSIICNRPNGEGADQPEFDEIAQAAQKAGLDVVYLPVVSGKVTDQDAGDFAKAYDAAQKPILAYCRTGTRSTILWSLSRDGTVPLPTILERTKAAGYDMSGIVRRILTQGQVPTEEGDQKFDVVIVGGGAAGISVSSSLLGRQPNLNIAIIDPQEVHYYQPGWTLVGAGVFDAKQTERTMGSLIPNGVKWIKQAVAAFEPENNAVILEGCIVVKYDRLIVCPGLKLDWNAIEGLSETLGKNGVTSNYRYDLAPYTYQLVKEMRRGKAIFTQPPMPIKCAGAPQKAMYLSADYWHTAKRLQDIDIQFMNAGGVLFGVKDYVPALESYVKKYDAKLNFFHTLTAIDGPAKKAWFDVKRPENPVERIEVEFDMMHVTPTQVAPDFVRVSPLADAAGWVDVDQETLRHKTYTNIWSLGDVMNAPNAKTAAAARYQAAVVAENVSNDIDGKDVVSKYNGYGSCPLTVERGKIVLAEFGYGGKLLPSFPRWLIDGTKPSRLSWILKQSILPPVYWKAMLRGREWMVKPEKVTTT